MRGNSEATEISPGALGMLSQNTIAGTPVSPQGMAQFFGLVPGTYVVVTVALPMNRENTEANLLLSALAGRYAAARVEAPAGEAVQVALPLP